MCLCSDVNKIREGIGDKIANFLQWTSAFVSGIVIGLVWGWKLALVIVAVSPLLVLCGGLMTYVSTFLCISAVILPPPKNMQLRRQYIYISLYSQQSATNTKQ